MKPFDKFSRILAIWWMSLMIVHRELSLGILAFIAAFYFYFVFTNRMDIIGSLISFLTFTSVFYYRHSKRSIRSRQMEKKKYDYKTRGMSKSIFDKITAELSEKQKALEEREIWLRTIVKSLSDGMIAINPSGKVSLCNPAATALFAYQTAQELTNKSICTLFPKLFTPAEIKSMFDSKSVLNHCLRAEGLRSDNSPIALELSLSKGWSGGSPFIAMVMRPADTC